MIQKLLKELYLIGVDVEKISQGAGYAIETVKEWPAISAQPLYDVLWEHKKEAFLLWEKFHPKNGES